MRLCNGCVSFILKILSKIFVEVLLPLCAKGMIFMYYEV